MGEMNLKEVNIPKFHSMVKFAMKMGMNDPSTMRPVLGLGAPGIGKTEGIAQLASELGVGYKEIRLVNTSEAELIGIPYQKELANGSMVTEYAPLQILPIEERDGEQGILVLDEITSCSKSLRTACFQLTDGQRKLGNYQLPKGWLVVALGNGISDGGNFVGLEQAFINRFRALRVKADYDVWKKWAIAKEVNGNIVAFLNMNRDAFMTFNPDTCDESEQFASPRSWKSFSDMLNFAEKEASESSTELDEETIDIYACSTVGENIGHRFSAFYKYHNSDINLDDIFNDKVTADQLEKLRLESLNMLQQNVVREYGRRMKEACPDKGVTEEGYKLTCSAMRFAFMCPTQDMRVFTLRDLQVASGNRMNQVFMQTRFIESELGKRFDEMVDQLSDVLS